MTEQRTIYTMGYNARGWTHQALWELIYQAGAKIIDCRFQPKKEDKGDFEWRGIPRGVPQGKEVAP